MKMHCFNSKPETTKENRFLFGGGKSENVPVVAPVPATAPEAQIPPESEVKAAGVKVGTSANLNAHGDNVGKDAVVTPAAAPGTAPAVPAVAPAAAPTVATAVAPGTAPAAAPAPAVDPATGKPAEGKEKPVAGAEDLPDNEWSQAFYNLRDQLTATPAMQGPLSTLALAVLRLAAKYSNYADLMPGSFRRKILESPEYKDKTLDSARVKKVLDRAKKTDGEKEERDKVAGDLKKQEDDLIKAGRRLGRERASTRFVNNTLLGGIEGIDDATSLAASLIHTKREVGEGKEPEYLYYSPDKNLETLKAGAIAKGTILIFVPDMSTGEKVVAYATDEKGNFAYYNVGKKLDGKDVDAKDHTGVIDFKLGEANCPVKQLGLLAVLEPNFEKFAATPETVPVAPTVSDKPEPAGLERLQSTGKALDKIEADNAGVVRGIEEYNRTKNKDFLVALKATAEGTFALAKKCYDDLKIMVESKEFNLAELKAVKDAAEVKSQATGASNEDKVAFVDAKSKFEQAENIQKLWSRIKTIYPAAEANKKKVDELK